MTNEEIKSIKDIKNHYNGIIKEFGEKANGSASCYLNSDIKNLLDLVEKQQKEIEEKTTMIFSGAEKVKSLEKEIEQLEEDLKLHEETSFDFQEENIKLRKENIALKSIIEKIKATLKINATSTTDYIVNFNDSNYISKLKLLDIKSGYQESISTMHPASDCMVIDWLEDRIQFIDELLGLKSE